MQTNENQNSGFWPAYISDKRSLITLIIVCSLIALFTNAMNRLGLLPNLMFSYCYGFPISLIETFIRTRKTQPTEWVINGVSILLGSVIGSAVVYSYLLKQGIVVAGAISTELIVNFSFGITISAAAFYFFWSQYRSQSLTLALREQQLKVAESENLKRQAENRLLQSQMEPHFLFNTLANVQSLIDIDAHAAKIMVANLSKMLRASLNNSEKPFCSVEQELSLVQAYQDIQAIRMGERLVFKTDVSDEILQLNMVPMLLQPIIENSIRHGVEHSLGHCIIRLEASVNAGCLKFVITDDCQPKNKVTDSTGLSLTNIRQRLINIYGDQAFIKSEAIEKGWRTELQLPIIKEGIK